MGSSYVRYFGEFPQKVFRMSPTNEPLRTALFIYELKILQFWFHKYFSSSAHIFCLITFLSSIFVFALVFIYLWTLSFLNKKNNKQTASNTINWTIIRFALRRLAEGSSGWNNWSCCHNGRLWCYDELLRLVCWATTQRVLLSEGSHFRIAIVFVRPSTDITR